MARALLLGPDRQRAAGLRGMLTRDGHHVTWLRSLDGWATREREIAPDIVIAAVSHAESVLGGADRRSNGFSAPLLFVQQEADFLRDCELDGRLVDRLASPFMSDELLARVDALVRVRQIVRRGAAPVASSGGKGITGRFSAWLRSRLPEQDRPAEPYLEVAARVAEWADRRDAFQPGHAERVTSFCAMIAEGLGMGEQETSELLRAAMLHDIGKAALPVEMLHQRGPLEDGQRRLIQTHPARGAALLRALDPDDRVARLVLCHHERPDGAGYYNKQADSVPRGSFALCVAEAYDAMTSSLLGRTVDPDEALDLLMSGRGKAYDADSVEALVDALKPRRTSIPLSLI